jgi:hypothetical protein
MKSRQYRIEGLKAKNIGVRDTSDTGESVEYTIVINFGKKTFRSFGEWQKSHRDYRGVWEYEFIPCKDYYDFFDKYIRSGRCGHEHDCCGCWNDYFTSAKRVGNKVYFKVSSSQNI